MGSDNASSFFSEVRRAARAALRLFQRRPQGEPAHGVPYGQPTVHPAGGVSYLLRNRDGDLWARLTQPVAGSEVDIGQPTDAWRSTTLLRCEVTGDTQPVLLCTLVRAQEDDADARPWGTQHAATIAWRVGETSVSQTRVVLGADGTTPWAHEEMNATGWTLFDRDHRPRIALRLPTDSDGQPAAQRFLLRAGTPLLALYVYDAEGHDVQGTPYLSP